MTNPFIEKARAGRRAALAHLNARLAKGGNVVSLYESRTAPRQTLPEFHSVRAAAPLADLKPVLVLTNRVAA